MTEDLGLTRWQAEGLTLAEAEWSEICDVPEAERRCDVIIQRGSLKGRTCPRRAGQGTWHTGYGRCVAHGGAKRLGRALGAWLMAHQFARELNLTPWDALLKTVRIAAGKVAYTEWVLSQARSDLELEGRRPRELTEDRDLTDERGNARRERVGTGIYVHPDTGEPLGADDARARDLSWWVQKNEYWVERLARYAKAAIDAGVAERLVAQVEAEASAIARPLNAALEIIETSDDLGLSLEAREELQSRMRNVIRQELLALEGERRDGDVVEGQVVS